MRKRLTDRTIKGLRPASADAAPADVMDTIVPGFGVRVMGKPEHPVRTYILRTRFPGNNNPPKCVKCGKVMDSWHRSTSFRSYDLIDET